MEIPRIISVDNHVIEPAHVWQDYLPDAFRDAGPRLTRVKGRLRFEPRHMAFREDADGYWADCWSFAGELFPVTGGFAAVSFPRDQAHNKAVIFDDILPGCYDRTARLADMDRNHTDASLCFPTFPRFCGQTFLERGDRDLALACVRAYNDWMIDEWCADEARGRLIPLTLIPMWDPDPGGAGGAALRGQGVARHRLLREPGRARPAQRPHRRLGSAVGRVRGNRHGGQHAHRLVLHLQQDQRRRAARWSSSRSPSRVRRTPWSTG